MIFSAESLRRTLELIGWLLVHSVWQFVVIALLVGVIVRLFRGANSNSRYVIQMFGLLCMVITPVLTCFLMRESRDVKPVNVSSSIHSGAISHAGHNSISTVEATANGNRPYEPGAQRNSTQASSVEQSSRPSVASTISTRLRPWLPGLTWFWVFGVCVFSARPLFGWRNIRRLQRESESVTDTVELMLRRVCSQFRISRRIRIRQSDQVEVPCAFGILRPVILLPISVVTGLTDPQLNAIIAHEIAHIRRHDFAANLAQTIVESLFFYHPAVWWLSAKIRAERENCCDDLVVKTLQDRKDYARALIALTEIDAAVPVPALSASGGSLLRRLRRLVEPERRPHSGKATLLPLVLTCVMLSILCGGVLTAWPVLAVTNDDSAEFGPESHGLRVRVSTVSADAKAPDAAALQPTDRYQNSSDINLLVEVQNVSRQQISLPVPPGHPKQPAQWGRVAPFLFELEFKNTQTNKTVGPKRQLDPRMLDLVGCEALQLPAGESLRWLIRPIDLMAPFSQELPAGQYSVRVRYRGWNKKDQEGLAKANPELPLLKTWSHSAESNATEFSVENDISEHRQTLNWGPPVNGLTAAAEYRVDPKFGDLFRVPGVPLNAPISTRYHIKNVSDRVITFVSETHRQDDNLNVTSITGAKVDVQQVWMSGWPIDVRWTLQPGQIAKLDVLEPTSRMKNRPGMFRASYSINFNSRQMHDKDGNQTFPAPGDYKSTLTTGETNLFFRGATQKKPAKPQTDQVADGMADRRKNGENSEPQPAADLKFDRFPDFEALIVDEETGKLITGRSVTFQMIFRRKTRGGDDRGRVISNVVWTPASGKFRFGIPDEMLQYKRPDMVVVNWGAGHQGYESQSGTVPLQQILDNDPKSARDQFRVIKLRRKQTVQPNTITRSAQDKYSVNFQNEIFFAALTKIESIHNLSISIDLGKLHALGVNARTKISLQAKDVTVRVVDFAEIPSSGWEFWRIPLRQRATKFLVAAGF